MGLAKKRKRGERMVSVILCSVFVVTAYCNCCVCCGKPQSHPAYGITASGKEAASGTVTVDPKVIPLGTRLKSKAYLECAEQRILGKL